MSWAATIDHVDKNKLPWAERSKEYIENLDEKYKDFKKFETDILNLEKDLEEKTK